MSRHHRTRPALPPKPDAGAANSPPDRKTRRTPRSEDHHSCVRRIVGAAWKPAVPVRESGTRAASPSTVTPIATPAGPCRRTLPGTGSTTTSGSWSRNLLASWGAFGASCVITTASAAAEVGGPEASIQDAARGPDGRISSPNTLEAEGVGRTSSDIPAVGLGASGRPGWCRRRRACWDTARPASDEASCRHGTIFRGTLRRPKPARKGPVDAISGAANMLLAKASAHP